MKVAQSCPTLCDPMVYTIPGTLQARTLEWVAFPFSGDLPNPGIEPRSPALQADSLPAEPPGKSTETGIESSRARGWLQQKENVAAFHDTKSASGSDTLGKPGCHLDISAREHSLDKRKPVTHPNFN